MKAARGGHSFTTTFGRNNVVDVETAMILRRVTSADAETLRPATSEQLKFRQAMLPRSIHSAGVIRKRELLAQLEEQCVTQRRTETKFQTRVPLVNLNIDMKVNAEPITAATAPKSSSVKQHRGQVLQRPPVAPSRLKPSTLHLPEEQPQFNVATLFQGFVAAQEAAQAMNAVDNLPESVIQSNPYLQHLRNNAEVALNDAAELLVSASRWSAQLRYQPAEFPATSSETIARDGYGREEDGDEDIPQHCKILFREWERFLTMCAAATSIPASDEGNIDADTERELFISFMRTHGNMAKVTETLTISHEEEEGNADGVMHEPTTAEEMTIAAAGGAVTTSQTPDVLDDLAPPSGGGLLGASDPSVRPMVVTRHRPTLVKQSAPLQRGKMMMDVHSKHDHLVRLMELSMLASSSGVPSARSTPTLQHTREGLAESAEPASLLSSPLKRKGSSGIKTMTEVQHQAREVFAQIRDEHVQAHVARVERQLEKHHQLGLRLNRSKNLDLYKLQQLEQHQRGLSNSATQAAAAHDSPYRSPAKPSQEKHAAPLPPVVANTEGGGGLDDNTAPNSPNAMHSRLPSSASLRSGPPSATHKLGGNPRAIGSAKSRPSSSGTTMSTPRGPTITLDLPMVQLRSGGAAQRPKA
ncbi:unnamed protein product [Bodo saltans]|uniref:Uncharacterized protein n=1 Tax=Bodo saltans TaxID=75058 RepID=A0A0S4IWL4_BODSA|nr:unnamed protein product [Bodo saltans]|eukprot:CUF99749.1 unnamed protein product [Bodo saltans]